MTAPEPDAAALATKGSAPTGWLPRLLARLPESVFRALGLAFFVGVLAWRATLFGGAWWPLWAAESLVYVTIVVAYARRRPALERASTWSEVVLPLVGGPLPFALVLQPENPVVRGELSVLLMLAGASLSFLSYVYLGGSFAILVEARPLRDQGPYALVRHPVYLGQLVAALGVLLFRFSAITLGLYLLLVVVQVARALLEERKLTRVSPGYADYVKRTWRFVPLVF